MKNNCLNNVRDKKPLIHNITNYVTANDVANALLAIGASPIMADEPEEVEDITSICEALNINTGTLSTRSISAMLKAGHRANMLNHVVVLDPVGAGASELRTKTVKKLLDSINFDAIKGNISEIKTLAKGLGNTKGVDANIEDMITEENLDEVLEFLGKFSKDIDSIIIVTGPIDIITDGTHFYLVNNGKAEMGKITGTGCQLSGILAAFLAANPDNKLEAAVSAVSLMGLAGEIGFNNLGSSEGNATYRNRIIDALYLMQDRDLKKGMKIELKK